MEIFSSDEDMFVMKLLQKEMQTRQDVCDICNN